jgi:hypothetical protein
MSQMAANLSRSQHASPATASHAHPGLRNTRPPLRPAHGPELNVEEIRFRQLTSAEEIASILHLRSEINLPSAGQADFAILEKKETSWGLSALSNGVDISSARSVSFPSATASRPASNTWTAPRFRLRSSPKAGK